MNDLDHAKLLQLAAAYENPREMIMVMEYIGGGELFEKVSNYIKHIFMNIPESKNILNIVNPSF